MQNLNIHQRLKFCNAENEERNLTCVNSVMNFEAANILLSGLFRKKQPLSFNSLTSCSQYYSCGCCTKSCAGRDPNIL